VSDFGWSRSYPQGFPQFFFMFLYTPNQSTASVDNSVQKMGADTVNLHLAYVS